MNDFINISDFRKDKKQAEEAIAMIFTEIANKYKGLDLSLWDDEASMDMLGNKRISVRIDAEIK